ncbi:hypothetical protein C530_279 [Candidatus Portiera aleyrodidarum BT-B-HRs]|nr:hypothetical protein C548_283 [Candidatus Portiera aleyrodidarum BT-QVLC]AFT80917.1 hypothetical protein C530_279 [Candidatus Portiera aleyrodidarum BT-B-HRs]
MFSFKCFVVFFYMLLIRCYLLVIRGCFKLLDVAFVVVGIRN